MTGRTSTTSWRSSDHAQRLAHALRLALLLVMCVCACRAHVLPDGVLLDDQQLTKETTANYTINATSPGVHVRVAVCEGALHAVLIAPSGSVVAEMELGSHEHEAAAEETEEAHKHGEAVQHDEGASTGEFSNSTAEEGSTRCV